MANGITPESLRAAVKHLKAVEASMATDDYSMIIHPGNLETWDWETEDISAWLMED